MGGWLFDHTGFAGTFASVGCAFLTLAGANYFLLPRIVRALESDVDSRTSEEEKSLLQQWKSLLENKSISNMILVNAGYWFVLSGIYVFKCSENTPVNV